MPALASPSLLSNWYQLLFVRYAAGAWSSI
jgi:hypothetical protein